MASEEIWDSEALFNLYLHDYMVNKNMKRSASIFKREANILDHSVAIDDSQNGLLHEWWSMFWDVYVDRHFESNKDKPGDSLLQAMQMLETNNQQSHSSKQPHFATGSFDPLGLNLPNTSSSFGGTSCPLSTEVFEQVNPGGNDIGLGRSAQSDKFLISSESYNHAGISNCWVNPEPLYGWPENEPNSQIQAHVPQVAPSTHGSHLSSPGNSADYISNLMHVVNNKKNGNDDQF